MFNTQLCSTFCNELCLFVFYDQRSRAEYRSESGIGYQRDEDEEQEEELSAVSKNLSVLLREQESIRDLKK